MSCEPSQYRGAMEQLAGCISSYTYFSIGDQASGKVLLQERIGGYWEAWILPKTGGKVLCFFDTCVVHLHHRCTLQVRSLKFHTMRKFSIAKRKQILDNVGAKVDAAQDSRHLGPRPADLPGSLAVVVDILYKPNSPHHLRKGGKAAPADR